MSASLAELAGSIDIVRRQALAIKAQRDQYRDALEDILRGADMMLQPSLNLTGAMLGYVKEVKRVAEEALK